MNGIELIQRALCKLMPEGEANACQVWKNWDSTGQAFGWWFKPLGQGAQPLGTTIVEALGTIDDWYVEGLID